MTAAAQVFNEELAAHKALTRQIIDIKNKFNSLPVNFPLLDSIWDAVPVMMFYKDTENRLVKINDHFAKTLGVEKESIEGKRIEELGDPTDAFLSALIRKYALNDFDVINTGKPKLNIVEPLFTDANRLFRTDKYPVPDKDGKVIGVLGVSVEIEFDNIN